MRRFALIAACAAALALGGCATTGEPPGPGQQGLTVAGAIAAEAAAQARCPRNRTEAAVLFAARVAFDIGLAPSLLPEQRQMVMEARARTDALCGLRLVIVPGGAEPPDPEPPAPPGQTI